MANELQAPARDLVATLHSYLWPWRYDSDSDEFQSLLVAWDEALIRGVEPAVMGTAIRGWRRLTRALFLDISHDLNPLRGLVDDVPNEEEVLRLLIDTMNGWTPKKLLVDRANETLLIYGGASGPLLGLLADATFPEPGVESGIRRQLTNLMWVLDSSEWKLVDDPRHKLLTRGRLDFVADWMYAGAVVVGYQTGFLTTAALVVDPDPLPGFFTAVSGSDQEHEFATKVAVDYLQRIEWFDDAEHAGDPPQPDFVFTVGSRLL